MPNGYDSHSSAFARPGRAPLTEATGTRRSDGAASQDRGGANRYDTSTPEKRRAALTAARKSGNPADEARVRKQINQEANSTIDALMLGLNMDGRPVSRRDNRATRRGGYWSTTATMAEAKGDLPPWLRDKEDVEEAKDDKDGNSGGDGDDSDLPPWLRNRRRNSRTAEAATLPQRRFRDTVDSMDEAELNTRRRNALPASDFALPGRRYPIPDAAHARNALARVVQNGSPAEIARVRAAVRRKFPDIDVSGGKKS